MQINEWLLKERAANPEELPAIPGVADGGSRVILQQAAAAAVAAAEPPGAKSSGMPPGKATQAPTTPAKKSKDSGDPSLYSPPMYEQNCFKYPGSCLMACRAVTIAQHQSGDKKQSVCIEPAHIETTFNMTRLSSAGKQAVMGDDMPRLSCPDLAAAIVRWQQVWEDRDEAGAKLGTALPLLLP